ncbi:Hypothetical protein FKW44_005929 [Caligus rogercresseyi]|uniref:Uncharacterized protein n=1 Tax=Caligus rogercresseyi TaxID=217165 RepID=A0A7T8KCM9_CALRO|nr:Hypothetical protein FKW44_005929 [Caligus rogercresseyi]
MIRAGLTKLGKDQVILGRIRSFERSKEKKKAINVLLGRNGEEITTKNEIQQKLRTSTKSYTHVGNVE